MGMYMIDADAGTGTERLARFVVRLDVDQVPDGVLESVKLRVLDILGICVAAANVHGTRAVEDVVASWGGPGEARVIGGDLRLPWAAAALVNGTRAHSLDFDDTHHAARVHPSAVIVPTAMAAGEALTSSGRDVLAAVLGGVEVMVRVGLAAPGRFHERGFHGTSVCGVVGAAAAASRLLGSDSATIATALAISACTASGLRESYLGKEATDTKALHAGWAAHAGVASAQLAAAGVVGPRTALEGRFGFYRAYVSPDEWNLGALDAGLGTTWYTPEVVFKLYPCGSLIHASIDAALSLRREHGIRPDEIEEVAVIVPPGMVSTVCEPLEQKLRPGTGYQAKFSAQYSVAAALLSGEVTEASFGEETIREPTLRDLLSRVTYRTDPALPFPEKYPGGVMIRTRDGRTLEVIVPNSPGSIDRPVESRDLQEKFLGNVAGRIPLHLAREVLARVLALEEEETIGPILALLATGDADR